MNYEYVRLERRGAVARLRLDRPPLNILHIPMLHEVCAALDEADADPACKVLVLTGAGKAFCAGVDVADHTAERVSEMLPLFHAAIRRLLDVDLAVVAALNGHALGGGCELALACDVVLAREDARIGQPEIALGVFPPAAAVLLPRVVGRQRALDLILTGRVLTAPEALQWGLIAEVVPGDRFEDRVDEWAAQVASFSRPVLRLAKKAVREALDLPLPAGLDRAEDLYLSELMGYADPHEGLAAFLEKRKPVWKDG